MSFFIPVVLTLLLSMSALVAAQDLCNCSPAEYTFRLKNNLDSFTCPTNPDNLGPGVITWFCAPSVPPVKITFARFTIEDPAGNIIDNQIFPDLNLVEGDTLPSFTSPNTLSPLVREIRLNLLGETADGSLTGSTWSITFTNECGVLPLEEGAELGLVVFVSFLVLISNDVYYVWKLTDTSPSPQSPCDAAIHLMIAKPCPSLARHMPQTRSVRLHVSLLLSLLFLRHNILKGGQGQQTF